MTNIDKTKPVMVTGATGYVAGWIIKKLLDEGITVHAAVRNPNDEKKIAHLIKLAENSNGAIKFYKSDLLDKGSYAEAMEGCELVFHTASPFTLDVKDPQKQLIEPAVEGTKNVLEQASQTPTVKRVVLTSSCAAIYCDAKDLESTPNGVFTEEVWNTKSSLEHQAYSYSKTLAEQEAWKIAKGQHQWDLVVVNPSFVLGPPLNPTTATSETINLMKQFANGTFAMGVPNIGMGAVDVRDLGEIHFNAGFTPTAEGRHIANGTNTNFVEIGKLLKKNFGTQYKLPSRGLPKGFLLLVGPLMNKSLSRKVLRDNINYKWVADNSKSINSLGAKYRPLEETLVDTFNSLIEAKVI